MNDQQLHAYCLEWTSWCFTRRFYIKPGAQSLLARMQPSRSGVEPNARNNPDMQYFNMAIHALADMEENVDTLRCFSLMYVEQADHVKRQADMLGISRPTYYNRARAFGRKAMSLAISLKRVHEEGTRHLNLR
ncbi:hypothetical protein BN2497_4163 [Janthinobacterium sp. CG23_2]|nr:hypothetical protein BN2497_4163 [Janthinobacterium sp. CG23_2]CUU28479.1 hypothetical protein BN3177_4163 [Janthinobacterium sp. CG23_2]